MEEFRKRDVTVVAASVDTLEDARNIVETERLIFSVGYGMDARQVSAATGAFFEEEKGYLHATGFLIKPDGLVTNAVYSTGSIGRLRAEDSLRVIGALSGTR